MLPILSLDCLHHQLFRSRLNSSQQMAAAYTEDARLTKNPFKEIVPVLALNKSAFVVKKYPMLAVTTAAITETKVG